MIEIMRKKISTHTKKDIDQHDHASATSQSLMGDVTEIHGRDLSKKEMLKCSFI